MTSGIGHKNADGLLQNPAADGDGESDCRSRAARKLHAERQGGGGAMTSLLAHKTAAEAEGSPAAKTTMDERAFRPRHLRPYPMPNEEASS